MATAVDGSLESAEVGVTLWSSLIEEEEVDSDEDDGSVEGVEPAEDTFADKDSFARALFPNGLVESVERDSFSTGFCVDSAPVTLPEFLLVAASVCEVCSTEGSSSPEKRRLIPQTTPERIMSETSAMTI